MIWLTLIVQTIGIYVVSNPARHDLFNVLNAVVQAPLQLSDDTSISSPESSTLTLVPHESKRARFFSIPWSRSCQLEEHEWELSGEDIDDEKIPEAFTPNIALPLPDVIEPNYQLYPSFVFPIDRVPVNFQCTWSYPMEGVDSARCPPIPETYKSRFLAVSRGFLSWLFSSFGRNMRRWREGPFAGFLALMITAWELTVRRLFPFLIISLNVCSPGPELFRWNLASV